MIQPVTTNDTTYTPPSTKPWAPGDPSSFAQLFSPILATTTAATTTPSATPAAATPSAAATPTAAATPATTTVAATPADTTSPAASAPATAAFAPTQFTFEQNATVKGFNTTTSMNPEELATSDTASSLATMLGGTVVNEPDYGGGWGASVPTRDIAFTQADGSQVKLNAGVLAYLFNNYGEQAGSEAWQQVNQTLGRDLMATTPVS